MAEINDGVWLRENWSKEKLGKFDGLWIAVHERAVLDASADLEVLLDRFQGQIHEGHGPLFAFVYFGIVQ